MTRDLSQYGDHCPLCTTVAPRIQDNRDGTTFDCPNCGKFGIVGTLASTRFSGTGPDAEERARLSFAIRRSYDAGHMLILGSGNYDELLSSTVLPRLNEQIDWLVRLIGERSSTPGNMADISMETDRARVGAVDEQGMRFLLSDLEELGVVECKMTDDPEQSVRLTMLGWQRCDEIKRELVHTSEVFMAMKYGDPEVDEAYKVFQAAVKQTGFHLCRLDEQPEAGSIDDRMIVAIRRSKFLIADLTHQNQGAYWEAGVAHGMGKKVIYTCRKSDHKEVHFNTSHYQAVFWDRDNLAEAAQRLKDTIRATFPHEAIMEDNDDG